MLMKQHNADWNVASHLLSMRDRSRSCGGRHRCFYHRLGISPDMPDCWPVDREDMKHWLVGE